MSLEGDINWACQQAMESFLRDVHAAQRRSGATDAEVHHVIEIECGPDFADAWYDYTDEDMDEGPERVTTSG